MRVRHAREWKFDFSKGGGCRHWGRYVQLNAFSKISFTYIKFNFVACGMGYFIYICVYAMLNS